MKNLDTIAAIATPAGYGGLGVIRVSGSLATKAAYALLKKQPIVRQAEYLSFYGKDGLALDQGIALFFLGPNSFTGEDILELQGHGSPVILSALLEYIISLSGIRIAKPGEFLERAYLNNKIDLLQAESVSDLIYAQSIKAAHVAVKSMKGAFSKSVSQLSEELTELQVNIEAFLNFPDDDIGILSNNNFVDHLHAIILNLNVLINKAHKGHLLQKGTKIAIAGKPNVGKSSLFNALIAQDAAIVSSIAGTTRDGLHEYINLDGVLLRVADTAGLRDTEDPIERIGIEHSWHNIETADHILFVVDIIDYQENLEHSWLEFSKKISSLKIPMTIICNKIDLTDTEIGIQTITGGYHLIKLSAMSGEGIEILHEYLKKTIGYINNTEDVFLAHNRHLNILETVKCYLFKCQELLKDNSATEVLAEELRLAQQALNEMTGQNISNDLLKNIFSKFCIGK